MSVRYDELRCEVDWLADFVGWRTMKIRIPKLQQDDPLLKLLLERHAQQEAEAVKQSSEDGNVFLP